jgi:hypothetical protein
LLCGPRPRRLVTCILWSSTGCLLAKSLSNQARLWNAYIHRLTLWMGYSLFGCKSVLTARGLKTCLGLLIISVLLLNTLEYLLLLQSGDTVRSVNHLLGLSESAVDCRGQNAESCRPLETTCPCGHVICIRIKSSVGRESSRRSDLGLICAAYRPVTRWTTKPTDVDTILAPGAFLPSARFLLGVDKHEMQRLSGTII